MDLRVFIIVVVVVVAWSSRLCVPDVLDVSDTDCLRLFDVLQSPYLGQQKLALDDGAPRPGRCLIGRFTGDRGDVVVRRRRDLVRPVSQLTDQPLHAVGVALAMVEVIEVGNDHRNRKRYGENAGDGAQRPDELSPDADRHHVTVPDGRHRHHGPPERVRNTAEVWLGGIGLGKVDSTGEQHDADQQKEDEQAEFTHASADRLAENLEALRVTRQFEDAEDADESNDPKDGERHRVRPAAAVDAGKRRRESDEVRQNRQQVDHVHDVARKRHSARRRRETQQQLRREPDDAHRFDDEKRVAQLQSVADICDRLCSRRRRVVGWLRQVGLGPRQGGCWRRVELRKRLDAENDDRQQDDADGQQRQHASTQWTFWVLEQ